MILFAQACERIAATSGKLEKIDILAAHLRTLDDADLQSAARFFTGAAFSRREGRTLALGGATIVAAARSVWRFSDAQLHVAYRQHGDLGGALSELAAPSAAPALFQETLTPASLKILFDEAADAAGKAAGKRRLAICERILAACTNALEAKYVVKIMTGELRIGLKEGLVIDAISVAFGEASKAIRRAAMAAADIGAVAIAARHHALHGIDIAYGVPIGFMLASPVLFGSSYREMNNAEWAVEDKFDGIRVQAHKQGAEVRLFSRTLSDVSHSYPDVVQALKSIDGDFILDGELVAQRDGSVLPFRYLQARLQRKIVSAQLLADVPVVYMVFDILASGREYLLDASLTQRRRELEWKIAQRPHVALAASTVLAEADGSHAVHAAFEDARARGHEGLVLKRTDSPYHPGRRGKWWLKLKRELSTLDVVVVAVEWGHGKRAGVLSDYTFAVRGNGRELLTIGKAYSGLTDAEIAELTQWFLTHRASTSTAAAARDDRRYGNAMAVEPKVVLEVAFDIIQPSSLHQSGFALRFPRIVRVRDDKPATEIDTIERVREIYRAMLEREGVTR